MNDLNQDSITLRFSAWSVSFSHRFPSLSISLPSKASLCGPFSAATLLNLLPSTLFSTVRFRPFQSFLPQPPSPPQDSQLPPFPRRLFSPLLKLLLTPPFSPQSPKTSCLPRPSTRASSPTRCPTSKPPRRRSARSPSSAA
jgi:hypothetical protein